MSIVVLENEIDNLDLLMSKKINELTFKNIISLIFHCFPRILEDNSFDNTEIKYWKLFHDEFLKELQIQNKQKWPGFFFIEKMYNIEAITDKSFVRSKNLLMLLLRLSYTEKEKEKHISSHHYKKILNNCIRHNIHHEIKSLSLKELLDLLETHINYYLKIYNNDLSFENSLGKTIIKLLQ